MRILDCDGNGTLDDLPMNGDPAVGRLGTFRLPPTWYAIDIANPSGHTIELMAVCQ